MRGFFVTAALFSSITAASAVTRQPLAADHGMVVTAQHLATDVGVEILQQGGNAIDAAVAVGYALAVTNPCCGNIGGGGFATIHLADGRDVFLNFREKAPLAAKPDMFLDSAGNVVPNASLKGHLAAGVPGTVMGLDALLAKYGTMKREQVMAPAIKLAEEGFVLDQGDVDILNTSTKDFAAQHNVASIFLHNGTALRAGETLTQKDLAKTLRAISAVGPDAFYKGDIAAKIEAASKAGGGIITREDLAKYSVQELAPLHCDYRGLSIVSAPPPSSGGTTLCEILGILKAYPLAELGFHSATSVHLMAEAMRHAYVDRNFRLGDPDFVKNPIAQLLSEEHLAAIRAKIDPARATPSKEVQPGMAPHEGDQTTHYSLVDDKGNAVSVTYTVNALFGAKVMAGDTGFFLNDEMDDFTIKPGSANLFGLVQGVNNAIAPEKRPLSSMSPTIVLKDGKPLLVVGSPGGSRIITIVLETILNYADHGMNIQEAVDAPRLHMQWLPDEIAAEPFALSPDTEKLLRDMGYAITPQTPWGDAEAILIGAPVDKSVVSSGNDAMQKSQTPAKFFGAHDDRRPSGSARGY